MTRERLSGWKRPDSEQECNGISPPFFWLVISCTCSPAISKIKFSNGCDEFFSWEARMPLDVDMLQLKSFVAIAETGTFGQAATRVKRTQSALSLQIKKLESQFG